ncbi:hypothetical protein [Thalassobellus citreus]|uniref:hypothetical protein n=1 Tax=Thalassobellus citreus TaxID=3367752 RepID=UPI003793C525
MKKSTFLIFTVLLIGLTSSAQELSCSDFKNGKFYIPWTQKYAQISIVSNDTIFDIKPIRDTIFTKQIVIRENHSQSKWENNIETGQPTYEIIEWIDDCTYRLTYDSSKMDLNGNQKWINDNNGIIVAKTKIEGKCLFYTSTMTLEDGDKISRNGIICLE